VNDKAVDVQSKSGTVDGADSQCEEEKMHSSHRLERTHTPATVAEPDSTMSNENGDQMMPADTELAESYTMVDYAADETSGKETARHRVQDDEDGVMSSNCDAASSGCRNLRDRFSLERHWGFDAMRSGNRSETVTKLDMNQAEDTKRAEPSSSEIGQKKAESVLERLSGLMSRKRLCTDEVGAGASGSIQAPASAVTADKQRTDSMRKKHRPDPLVLPASSVEHYGYPSWLRSPRVWSGSGPIPYTPPPMLSPARRAPGLFWAAARSQNQPLWSMFRQPSAFTCELFYVNTIQ